MNQEMTRILVVLSVFGALGVTPNLLAAENAGQHEPPAPTAAQTAKPQTAQPTVAESAVTTEKELVSEETPVAEQKPATSGTEGAAQAVAESAAAEGEAAPEKEPAPVTGAFGIPLGERFEPCMVAKIISQEEKTFRGPDKVERKGILYQVEPRVANTRFNKYSVATTADGIIYSIRAHHEPPEKASKCDVSKKLGAILEDKYGKPRGKGMLGEWYAFRDMSSSLYRGVRLYAPKCRVGRYSIHYSDDNAKTAEPPPAPEPTEQSGL